jgi:hypothetical protein
VSSFRGALQIVIKEIESWYLAGMDDNFARTYNIKWYKNTDNITKEDFDKIIPKKLLPRENFMIEILKSFSMDQAKIRNKSLRYFVNKYDC